MTDTPGANPTQLPTELSYTRQPSEESEHDNYDTLPTTPDIPADVGEPNQNSPCSYHSRPTVLRVFF